MEYKIVTSHSAQDLTQSINHYLNDGWVLQGGVTMTTNGYHNNDNRYAQAIVRTK